MSASGDGTAQVWDATGQRVGERFRHHDSGQDWFAVGRFSVDIDKTLNVWGLSLPDDASVEWEESSEDPEMGRLVATASRGHIDRIATLVRALDNSANAPLVSIQTKFYEVPRDMMEPDAVLILGTYFLS